MYLNDCQRTDFYEGIGLNTKEFDMHVIIEVAILMILIYLMHFSYKVYALVIHSCNGDKVVW